MAEQSDIVDTISYRFQLAAEKALTAALAIQNVNGLLCQVDEFGNVTPLLGGVVGGILNLTGDVVANGPGTVNSTIQPKAVTYAKIQDVSNGVFLGNNSGGAASVQEITAASARSLLGLAAIATSGNAADLTGGTLPAGRFPALTGDVTTTAGSLATVVNIPSTRIPFGDGSNHMTSSASLFYNDSAALPQLTAQGTQGGIFRVITSTANGSNAGQLVFRTGTNNYMTIASTPGGTGGHNFSRITTQSLLGGDNKDKFDWVNTDSGQSIAGIATNSAFLDAWFGSNVQIATGGTGGFLWLPTVGGVPTGVPALNASDQGARQAIVIDPTDRRLYGYIGGAWHYANFDDGAATGIDQLTGDGTAGPGTGSVAFTLANTAVTPGSYTSVNLTVDSKGRITAASNGAGGGISALTGDVTASGSGSVVATIAANAVTFAKMQTIADQRLIGNVSGGTAVPSALTGSQVEAMLFGALATGIVGVTTATGALNSTALTASRVMYATGANTIGQSDVLTFAVTATHGRLTVGSTTVAHDGAILVNSGTNGVSIGGGVTVGLYVADPNAAGAASIAVDDYYFGQRLIGYNGSLNLSDLYVGVGTGNVLHFDYLMDRVGGGTDAMTIDGTSGAISILTATTITAALTITSATTTVNGSIFASSSNGGIRTDANGNLRIGKNATLATNATDGFPQMPNVAGRFTGTPTLPFTGGAPFGYDNSHNNLSIWSAAAAAWLVFPAFNASTATPGAQTSVLTNLPAAVVSTTPKWEVVTDASGIQTYRVFWQ